MWGEPDPVPRARHRLPRGAGSRSATGPETSTPSREVGYRPGPMRDRTARRLSALHRVLYRATGGRVGRRLVRNDMLLLTTTGRRTGRRHTVPLLYLVDGDDPIVIASWGGRPTHPEWYQNLVADPCVEVQVRSERFRATARPLPEPERTTWFTRAVAAYPGYADYQARTDRVIPVVRLVRDDRPHLRRHHAPDAHRLDLDDRGGFR